MQFDSLHMVLIGLLCSLGGGIVLLILKRSSFVSCRACKERHALLDKRLDDGERKFRRLEGLTAALVVYNPHIPEDKKAGLLAPTGGEE